MFQSTDHKASEPLTELMLQIVQNKCRQIKWKRVKIESKLYGGMMIVSCSVDKADGSSELLQLPIEYCDLIKQVRDKFTKEHGKNINTINFEVISNGAYDIEIL